MEKTEEDYYVVRGKCDSRSTFAVVHKQQVIIWMYMCIEGK